MNQKINVIESASRQKNAELELLRFVFACGIMLFHFTTSYRQLGAFESGYIGVEFFFLLSGLFMAHSAQKTIYEKRAYTQDIAARTLPFIKRKIAAFYPYFLTAILFQIVFRRLLMDHWSLFQLGTELFRALPSLTLIDMAGFSQLSGAEIAGTWYFSVMVLGMLFLYPLLVKNYELCSKLLFPLLGIACLACLYIKNQGICFLYAKIEFVNAGLIRGIGEMALGVFCYEAACRIKAVVWTKYSLFFFQILKWLCYFGTFIYMCNKHATTWQIHIFLVMMCGVTLSFAFETPCITKPSAWKKLFYFCGTVSLPLYLIHNPVKGIALSCMGTHIPLWSVISLMLASIVVAIVLRYGTDRALDILKRLKPFFVHSA